MNWYLDSVSKSRKGLSGHIFTPMAIFPPTGKCHKVAPGVAALLTGVPQAPTGTKGLAAGEATRDSEV